MMRKKVSIGTLLIATSAATKGNYTVATGAMMGLTVATGSSLEFQKSSSTTIPLIAASNVTVNGSCVVKLTGASGLVAGSSYPLVSYSGTFSGSLANLQSQMPSGWRGALVHVGNFTAERGGGFHHAAAIERNLWCGSIAVDRARPAHRWRLEVQTNASLIGLSTNWFPMPGTATTNQFWIPVKPGNGSVFFRLVYP
jgi:hypothetical protein